MEHAPLRPVPARPAGPIDPATAIREVGLWLPTVTPAAARAFALVVLAERPRPEAAASLGVSERELGELLASARKELRQSIVTLGGSGWCERAEGLISDRLDGALADGDVRRLDVHLRNCTRCVEHERRLVQATDALVGALGGLAKPAAGGASAGAAGGGAGGGRPTVEAAAGRRSAEGGGTAAGGGPRLRRRSCRRTTRPGAGGAAAGRSRRGHPPAAETPPHAEARRRAATAAGRSLPRPRCS